MLEKYDFDVVVILGGGLYRSKGQFYPAKYEHADQFGMLGGDIRIDAALALYVQHKAINFLFSTGVSAKELVKYGPSVSPGAQLYAKVFLQRLAALPEDTIPAKPPNIFIEDVSNNTFSNLLEVTAIIQKQGWNKAVLVSSDYHIPRVAALFELLGAEFDPPLQFSMEFLSAERVVRDAYPGLRDAEIDAAYATDAAIERLKNEQKGLQDIKDGSYVRTEYQLHDPRVEK